jgi:hypothetical protein
MNLCETGDFSIMIKNYRDYGFICLGLLSVKKKGGNPNGTKCK